MMDIKYRLCWEQRKNFGKTNKNRSRLPSRQSLFQYNRGYYMTNLNFFLLSLYIIWRYHHPLGASLMSIFRVKHISLLHLSFRIIIEIDSEHGILLGACLTLILLKVEWRCNASMPWVIRVSMTCSNTSNKKCWCNTLI